MNLRSYEICLLKRKELIINFQVKNLHSLERIIELKWLTRSSTQKIQISRLKSTTKTTRTTPYLKTLQMSLFLISTIHIQMRRFSHSFLSRTKNSSQSRNFSFLLSNFFLKFPIPAPGAIDVLFN